MADTNEQLYIRELQRYPILTPQEEKAVIRLLKVNLSDWNSLGTLDNLLASLQEAPTLLVRIRQDPNDQDAIEALARLPLDSSESELPTDVAVANPSAETALPTPSEEPDDKEVVEIAPDDVDEDGEDVLEDLSAPRVSSKEFVFDPQISIIQRMIFVRLIRKNRYDRPFMLKLANALLELLHHEAPPSQLLAQNTAHPSVSSVSVLLDLIQEEAKQKLVTANLRFVVSVARRYQNRGLSLLELISEGNIGLFKAAQRFDESKDVKFISYAVWWIRQGIQKALFDQVGTVRIPPNKLALANRFKRALSRAGGDYERTIESEEFREHKDEIPELLGKLEEISLNATLGGGEDGENNTTYLDLLGFDGEQEIESSLAEDKTVLSRLLKELLNEREAKVLRMYFGINYPKEFTFDEIGKELHLTRERVRQIKNKSVNKLAKNKDARDVLYPFLASGGGSK